MNILRALQPYRPILYVLAAIGLVGINGVFLYYALLHPETMSEATQNPISLVFQVEAFLLMGFFAWLISRLGLEKPGWLAFIVLSLAGSLAFSVPVFLLLHMRKRGGVSGEG